MITTRIKGIQVQWIDPINSLLPFLTQHTTMAAILQQPIICPLVFGNNDHHPVIQLTTGWLLGTIRHWDRRVHTPSLGFGHYLSTYEVISLFVLLDRMLREIYRLPKTLSTALRNQGSWMTKQSSIISGGGMCTRICSSMTAFGPI